jgi:hypothetical protein
MNRCLRVTSVASHAVETNGIVNFSRVPLSLYFKLGLQRWHIKCVALAFECPMLLFTLCRVALSLPLAVMLDILPQWEQQGCWSSS